MTAQIQTQMVARELVNPSIPPLKNADHVGKALDWMAEFQVRQLPVIEDQQFLGIISEDVLLDVATQESLVASLPITHGSVFVHEDAHFYEILRLAESHQLEIMTVLDEEDRFKGLISIRDSVMTFARLMALQNPGGILVLLMNFRDYTLAELARLVEENGAKILSVYTEPDAMNPQLLRVTLKINRNETGRIAATLERFEYRIIGRYEQEVSTDWAQDRLDSFLKYLEL